MSRTAAYGWLFAGLFLVSTSGPFLRMAHLPAFAVAFWRMAGAGLLFLAWAAARRELRVTRGQLRHIALGALFLATHFAMWIKAFDLTDYASNLLLLVSEPVMGAVLGIFLGERPTRGTWISVALAAVGLAIVAGGDFRLGPRALFGDLLCVLGGVAITLFFVVTRDARRALPLATFMGTTMAVGAAFVLPLALGTGAALTGHPPASWAWLAAIVVLTTVGGHGLSNLAARHVSLFAVNVVIVLEPAIAIAMGAALFGADVTAVQLAGGAILAGSVVVGLRSPPGTAVAQPSE